MSINGLNEFMVRIVTAMIDQYALEYAYDSGNIDLFDEFIGSVSRDGSGIIVHSDNSAVEHLIGPAESASPRTKP